MRTTRRDPTSGSVFVELLWTVPLFIAGIVLIALVGIHLSSRSSLQDSVTQALSLAATRGHSKQLSEDIIPSVSEFLARPGDFSPMRRLLVAPPRELLTDAELRTIYKNALDGTQLEDLNRAQLLALVYVQQALSLASLGEALFPCEPGDVSSGCLQCSFLPPARAPGGPPPVPQPLERVTALSDASLEDRGRVPVPVETEILERAASQRLEMWCNYRPRNRLLDTLLSISRAFGFEADPALGRITVHGAVDAFPGF